MNKPGSFIISLDFELHWGLFDHTELTDKSRAYFDRARSLIPPTLELFESHGIHASWATVGMLFARSKEELLQSLPRRKPAYNNPRFDPYRLLPIVGEDEHKDPYHYAPSLIAQIAATKGQQLSSHTFCHYYCLENGQTLESFNDDLAAANALSLATGYSASTALVFPRNQYRPDYFSALHRQGFTTYRGNPNQWFWHVRSGENTTLRQRAARLVDNYLAFGNSSTLFGEMEPVSEGLHNVPSSRFLRPYIGKIDGYGGQRLKVKRVLNEMTTAARGATNYHLWWHPHNLATHPVKNMTALEEIVGHYQRLNNRYGWQSHSMESHVSQLNRPTS